MRQLSIGFRCSPLAALALVAVVGCGSPTESDPPGTSKQLGDLRILALPASAPPFFEDSVAFYARTAANAGGSLYFKNSSGGRGERFAEFSLEGGSLLARPDGTPFGANDSIRIVMRVVAGQFMVELSPAGLQFNPQRPAKLRLRYEEADRDIDGDGDDDDGEDHEAEQQLSIWRQAAAGDPFVKIGTVKVQGSRELEARLTSFSRYAIAY